MTEGSSATTSRLTFPSNVAVATTLTTSIFRICHHSRDSIGTLVSFPDERSCNHNQALRFIQNLLRYRAGIHNRSQRPSTQMRYDHLQAIARHCLYLPALTHVDLDSFRYSPGPANDILGSTRSLDTKNSQNPARVIPS